jgi:glycosyltransferase involved in cell wall biosynthesis
VSVSGKRRVGLVIGQLTVGGAEGQLLQVVRRLGPRFEPIVYSLSARPTAMRSALAEQGIAVREIVGSGLSRTRRLAAALREDRIDIAHSWLFIANAYVAAAKLTGGPWHLVTAARNCKVQGLASRLANVVAFRVSERIVVNSVDVETYITREYRAPRDRIRVIANGVDTGRFRPAESNAGGRPLHVVTVGRVVRQKNHALFLDAARQLLERGVDARFTIVGDGPLRAELGKRAAELGIAAQVTFAGERHDVEEILRTADLFWLTSSWEGMPNAVLEALASGVPVVVTEVSGTRELVEPGKQGYIVGLDDSRAIAERSAAILGDAAVRAAMAAAARERALLFSTDAMVAKLEGLYDEMLETES